MIKKVTLHQTSYRLLFKRFFSVFLSFLIILGTSISVSDYSSAITLPSRYVDEFSQNNIVFYNPCSDSNSGGGGGDHGNGPSDDWGGDCASLSAAQIDWLTKYHNTAAKHGADYGIPWEVPMAQSFIESSCNPSVSDDCPSDGRRGPGTSWLARNKNNFFGIKAYNSCPRTCAITYSSPDAGWKGYFDNIKNTSTYRNHGAFDHPHDPYGYIKAIKEAGYATDPSYVDKISRFICGIEKYAKEQGWSTSRDGDDDPSQDNQDEDSSNQDNNSSDYECTNNKRGDDEDDGGNDEPIKIGDYAFPLKGATKSNYLNPGGPAGYSVLSRIPCNGTCHHDYNAIDMGINKKLVDGSLRGPSDYPGTAYSDFYYFSSGVKVLAFTSGKITTYKPYSRAVNGYQDKCASVTFMGDDGNQYWFGHMTYDSSRKAGDYFSAGDVIGEVGPPQCAIGTQAHFHIHMYINANAPCDKSHSSNCSHKVIEIMNELYEKLPE